MPVKKMSAKKILASILVMAFLFSSISFASLAAVPVTSVMLPAVDGITYTDEDGAPFDMEYAEDYPDIYGYSIESLEGGWKITPAGTSLRTFTFGIDTAQDISGVSVTTDDTGVIVKEVANGYRLTLTRANKADVAVQVTVERPFKVTFSEAQGYTFTPATAGASTVKPGEVFDFYVTPKAGYEEAKDVTATSGTITKLSSNLYRLSDVTADTVISAVGSQITHTVTLVGVSNYTYKNAAGTDVLPVANQVNDGASFSFRVQPADGYRVVSVTDNNGPVSESQGVYTISNITKDLSVNVAVEKVTVSVTEPDMQGVTEYTYRATTSTSVEYGGSFSFYVLPVEGYDAPVVKVNNVPVESLGSGLYVISNIKAAQTITIEKGEKTSYDVTLNNGTGYTVAPVVTGSTSVPHGENYSFTVTLQPEYGESDVTVTANGVVLTADSTVGNVSTYTIKNVTQAQVVSVSGAVKNTYSVTLPTGTVGYTVSTTQYTTGIVYGSSFSFTLTAAQGYDISNVVVKANGQPVEAQKGVYTVEVTENVTISVEGEKAITPSVTISSGVGYTVNKGTGNNVTYGDDYDFTVTLETGYQLKQVILNGKTVLSAVNGVYYITGITANQEVRIEVEKVTYTVNYVDAIGQGAGQVVYTIDNATPEGVITLPVPSLSEDVKDYYTFTGWKDDNNTTYTTLTIGEANAAITLTASWTVNWDKVVSLVTSVRAAESGDRYNLLSHMSVVIANIFDGQDVKITGSGMFYSSQALDADSLGSYVASLTDRTSTDSMLTQRVSNTVFSYYYNVDYRIEELSEVKMSFTKIPAGANRSIAGWIELTVNGEKMVFFSNIETGTPVDFPSAS